MKVTNLISIIISLLTIVSARIWTLDNDISHQADFRYIHDAIMGIDDGDSIYISGSSLTYEQGSHIYLEKEIHLFGPGYFLGENSDVSVSPYSAVTNQNITFRPLSSGSSIQGLHIQAPFSIASSACYSNGEQINNDCYGQWGVPDCDAECLSVQDILIQNNLFDGYNITIRQDAINVRIIGNILEQGVTLYNGSYNITINNNIIGKRIEDGWANTFAIDIGPGNPCHTPVNHPTNMIVSNNILYGKVGLWNAVFTNNIWVEGSTDNATSGIMCTPSLNDNRIWVNVNAANNLYHTTEYEDLFNGWCSLPTHCIENGNENFYLADPESVFIGPVGNSFDGQFQIAPGSIAEGNGLNGGDIGIFGGATPYRLSGVPPIPSIYFFNAPNSGSASSNLPVHIKAKSND